MPTYYVYIHIAGAYGQNRAEIILINDCTFKNREGDLYLARIPSEYNIDTANIQVKCSKNVCHTMIMHACSKINVIILLSLYFLLTVINIIDIIMLLSLPCINLIESDILFVHAG